MNNKRSLPLWATVDRQTQLVDLFNRSGGFCVFGHKKCQVPSHHYSLFIDDLVKDWIAEDRAERYYDWIAEQKAIHSLGERYYPLRGQFSAISKTIFADHQPLYYLDGLSISGITLTPFAKVRIASSYVTLYIDLGKTLKSVSKARRRKAIRYGKPLPLDTARDVHIIVKEAVKHYLAH